MTDKTHDVLKKLWPYQPLYVDAIGILNANARIGIKEMIADRMPNANEQMKHMDGGVMVELSKDERALLADEMIYRWTRYKDANK